MFKDRFSTSKIYSIQQEENQKGKKVILFKEFVNMGFHGNPLQKKKLTQLWTHGDCCVNLSEERRKGLVTLNQVEQKGTNTNYGIYHQK